MCCVEIADQQEDWIPEIVSKGRLQDEAVFSADVRANMDDKVAIPVLEYFPESISSRLE